MCMGGGGGRKGEPPSRPRPTCKSVSQGHKFGRGRDRATRVFPVCHSACVCEGVNISSTLRDSQGEKRRPPVAPWHEVLS